MHDQFDGQKQRSALTAAERSLRALGSGDGAKARESAAKAHELDQIGLYSGFVSAVAPLIETLEAGDEIADPGWNDLKNALGAGPLSSLIDEIRS
ncbi:MAG: hypothetical protein HKN91_11790 [Acidimicrobiia bacterium]|nr:hypothetical protein [Acidimicrobiia bacterium]